MEIIACLPHNFSVLREIIFKFFKKLFHLLALTSRVEEEKSHAFKDTILLGLRFTYLFLIHVVCKPGKLSSAFLDLEKVWSKMILNSFSGHNFCWVSEMSPQCDGIIFHTIEIIPLVSLLILPFRPCQKNPTGKF